MIKPQTRTDYLILRNIRDHDSISVEALYFVLAKRPDIGKPINISRYELCQRLKNLVEQKMIEFLHAKHSDLESLMFRIISITQRGKNYIDSHISWIN